MIDIDALEKLATAATPGPWAVFDRTMISDEAGLADELADVCDEDHAAFIAAANPKAVLELIAEVRRLRAELNDFTTAHGELNEAVVRLKCERDHWKANHDNQVARARFLIERGDIPLERVRAYEEMATLREDAERYHWAISLEDNTEALYAAVMSCGPQAVESINIEVDAARGAK